MKKGRKQKKVGISTEKMNSD